MSAAPAAIIGAYEHPLRKIPDGTVADVLADVSVGAMLDAGIGPGDIDGLFVAGVHQGLSPVAVADHLGLDRLRHLDSTDIGGASTMSQVGHAVEAIAAGKCRVALVAMGGRPLSAPGRTPVAEAGARYSGDVDVSQIAAYALVARRHMHEFGTTRRQLAMVKVTASEHASRNPNARLPFAVTVDEVAGSPLISDPLRRLDCCVTTDGGGALIIAAPDVARRLGGTVAWVKGWAETARTTSSGRLDLMRPGGERTAPAALEQAGVTVKDIRYASLYDSFTITVLVTLEALGFCAPGRSGPFVEEGGLRAPFGALPFNTDGGGLSNNHPDRRGGMPRTIEAVRQIRGGAHPDLQVADCDHALVHGTGNSLGTTATGATLVLGRDAR